MTVTRLSRPLRRCCAAVCSILILAAPAAATTLRALGLGDLTTFADRVFIGRVLTVRPGTDTSGFAVTWTTFSVDETLKGSLPVTVTIKQLTAPAGVVGGAIFRVPGLPEYRLGEKVLLFLNPDSPAGFTSPVGLAQGCFRIAGDGADAVAENDLGNVNIGAGDVAGATAPRASLRGTMPGGNSTAVSPTDAARPSRAPIALDELVGRVRALETAGHQ